jgi:hypothetical protein
LIARPTHPPIKVTGIPNSSNYRAEQVKILASLSNSSAVAGLVLAGSSHKCPSSPSIPGGDGIMFQQFARSVLFLILAAGFVGRAYSEEPVVLKYKLEKGAVTFTRHKTEHKTTQTINGMEIKSEMAQVSVDVRTIDDLTADGTAKIKSKTMRLKNNSNITSLGDYKFDSQKTDRDTSSVLGAALTPLYERLVGGELQSEVTPLGVVKSLTGYAQLVGDLAKSNPLTAQFCGGGTDNAAKLMAQGNWVVFTDKPVKPGDKWENPYEMEMAGLGVFKGKETVTFMALEVRDGHSIAKLSVSNDLAFDLKVDMGAAKVTGKVTTSSSEGSAEFDVTTGKLLSQKSKMTLTGQLSVDVNNMTIPVAMVQDVSSELSVLDKLPE